MKIKEKIPKYRDKKWLKQQYIKLNKTKKQIGVEKDFGLL